MFQLFPLFTRGSAQRARGIGCKPVEIIICYCFFQLPPPCGYSLLSKSESFLFFIPLRRSFLFAPLSPLVKGTVIGFLFSTPPLSLEEVAFMPVESEVLFFRTLLNSSLFQGEVPLGRWGLFMCFSIPLRGFA
jgi:hypothetical protein